MFQGSKLDQEIPVLKSFKLALQMSCPSSHIISLGKPMAIWAFRSIDSFYPSWEVSVCGIKHGDPTQCSLTSVDL